MAAWQYDRRYETKEPRDLSDNPVHYIEDHSVWAGGGFIYEKAMTDLVATTQRVFAEKYFKLVMNSSWQSHMRQDISESVSTLYAAESMIELWLKAMFTAIPAALETLITFFALAHLCGDFVLTFEILAISSLVLLDLYVEPKWTLAREDMRERRNARDRLLIDRLIKWETVKNCHQIQLEIANYNRKAQECSASILRTSGLERRSRSLQDFASWLVLLPVCVIEARRSMGEDAASGFPTSRLISVMAYWSQLAGNVCVVSDSVRQLSETTSTARQIRSILALHEVPEHERDKTFDFSFKGGVYEVDSITFGYTESKYIIRSLSFATPSKGCKTAIVGASGSGKTTILHLLGGLLLPSQGNISVDDQNIGRVASDSYRRHMGVVPQHPSFLDISIMDNVRYAAQDASDARVIHACKQCLIHDRIMEFPRGYQERFSSIATKLSGGERQRLAISRMLVQNPQIVILDEPTSSMDSIMEAKLWSTLYNFCQGRTTFMVTHRLAMVENVDKILVIEGGCIVEEGRHKDLIVKEGGLYSNLVKASRKETPDSS